MAVMGYGIANLALGVGAMIILMGAGTMAFLARVLYLAIAKEEEEEPMVKAATLALTY
tara:strand:- start:40 stop:213 length:174 start_codon:yes stop_codon:yes gene_type:complete